jgi:hypothetical protein
MLVCGIAIVLLLGIGAFVMSDTWLALAAGRVVAAHGPPAHDTLTAWTLGREWIDQQWLGQLALYELWRAGGLGVLAISHVVVVVAAYVAAIAVARRRGGSTRHVAAVALLAAPSFALVAGNIRTQTFALPLFVAVLALVAGDSRRPSRRVLWTAPLLVLWANVHGSVVIGAALVALGGTLALASPLRARGARGLGHGVTLIAIAFAAPFLTPYGADVVSYFRALLGNGEVAAIASDWMPTSPQLVFVPFYLLAGVAIALVAREHRALTRFEQLSLGMLLVGAFAAQRNLAWFALAAVMFLPALLTRLRPTAEQTSPAVAVAVAVAAFALAGVVAAAVTGLSAIDRRVDERYPPAGAEVVARALTATDAPAYIDPKYADWLLATQPRLAGRVPFDIRFELLSEGELRSYSRVRDQLGDDWRQALRGARILVLDDAHRPLGTLPPTSEVVLREAGGRVLYREHDLAVVELAAPARRGGRR